MLTNVSIAYWNYSASDYQPDRRANLRQSEKPGSSAYATGGGGVVLEHEYAASALASLLLAQPIEGLGDEFNPLTVAVQQGAHSAVDDVAIEGISPGGRRTLRVACRRRPTIGRSEESTVKLFADFLDALASDPISHTSGRARLGLAISAPFGPASELATLTEIARRQPDHPSFVTAVNAQGAYSSQVRVRLQNVFDLIEAAETHRGNPSSGEDHIRQLTWQLLQALFVIDLLLEGDVAPGRTNVVARLTALTGDASRAEDLRLRLVNIAGASEIRAGAYTRPMLRRDLRSFGLLAEAPDFIRARPQVEALESELRARTSSSLKLPGTGEELSIDRSVVVKELVQLTVNSPPGTVIIVHGEPDVGKSAVALLAADSIRSAGGVALVASLRDLPPAVIELRAALGMAPDELLSAAPSAPKSALFLDGAEVIQECDCQSAGAFVRAAIAAGITTLLVVRDDAVDSLRNQLRTGVERPNEFLVSPLAPDEIAELAKTVPTLARVTADARAAWLLRRIGLVDLLLRAVQLGIPMPTSLSSEAEIFSIVWSGLIRRNEAIIGSVSPDDREAAAIEVARALLTGQPAQVVGGAALPSLRSDGVLLSRKAAATWEKGDRFASDVLRDFATARLLLQSGLKMLADANAPRWTVRAARLFAQAQLARVVLSPGGTASEAWKTLRVEFADLSANHGQRWTEVPWESLLTAGWADKLLAQLVPTLTNDAVQLAELLRTTIVRFSDNGASDVTVAAPLISWLLENRKLDRKWSIDDAESPRKHVLRWLRGVARLEAAQQDVSLFQDLRGRIRDALIPYADEYSDPEILEPLGLLGKDSTDASNQVLTAIGRKHPGFLAPVVESVDVARLMSQRNPKLLAWLAEQYYIEKPKTQGRGSTWHDEGIRHHEARGGQALAAWYRGPFLFLLREDFARGLRLIDRMLDRGARDRLETSNTLHRQMGGDPSEEFVGLELDFADSGPRNFVGDQHVWSWYRGSSVGPYPCMSALFSLEIFMDGCVRSGIDVRTLTTRIMRDASTLASVGLCCGFLVRHIDKVSKELDGLLADPTVWELEFSRVSHEGSLHVQGADDSTVPGRERRGWMPLNVAMYFVVGAMQRRDDQRLKELRDIGDRLIQNAGGDNASPTVKRWAAHLDWKNYMLVEENGQRLIKAQVPEEVTEALAPVTEDIEWHQEMYRLLNRYRLRYATPYRFALAELPPDEELEKDVQAARRLEKFAQDESSDPVRCAVSGVAAAVLRRATETAAGHIPATSLNWAQDLLIRFAVELNPSSVNHPESMYSLGGDRQAALALPLTVVSRAGGHSPTRAETQRATPPRGHGFVHNCSERISACIKAIQTFARTLTKLEPRIDNQADVPVREKDVAPVLTALQACTCSPSVEVRQCVAEGLRTLFDQSCSIQDNGRCWHEGVWLAIEAGARRVVLGDFSENGRADIQAITGDLGAQLRDAPDRKLMLTYIEPAAISAMDAARTATCIKPKAEALRGALLQAYARAASVWAEHNYHRHKEQGAAFASAVLRSAMDGGPEIIIEIGRMLSNSPGALADYLDALVMASTYETGFVQSLSAAWAKLMEIALLPFREPEKHEHRYSTTRRLDSLIPSPRTSGYFEDPEPVMKKARTQWFPPTAISEHLEEWLRYAHGDMHAVDALVGFLQTRPLPEQVRLGLEWVHKIVIDDDRAAAACGFLLVGWLHTIRGSLVEEAPKRWYREIVDALVLGRYVGARELQALDE